MKINPVSMMMPQGSLLGTVTKNSAPSSPQGFSTVLLNALRDVNQLQLKADESTQKLVIGEGDIHQVMLDGEKAKLAVELTVQIRNKLVEAYQEVSRMQI
ncbi:MAG: flagellar hook-basal body complex protein FliE [Firmicutes bacterium]|nr:flagellar hook-basal body complex protein FliE [Bacillota bacterium]